MSIRSKGIRDEHPLAGQTVLIHLKGKSFQLLVDGAEFKVEDWWINVNGTSWGLSEGNPACLIYAVRAGMALIPLDEEVVYGHIGGLGYLVHTSELGTALS